MGDLGLCPRKPNEVDSCMCVVVCGDECLLWVAAEFCPPQAACVVHPTAIQGVATGNQNAPVSKLRGLWSSMHARPGGQQDEFQYDASLDNGRRHRRRRRGPEWGGDSDLQPHNDVNKPAAGARGVAGACVCVEVHVCISGVVGAVLQAQNWGGCVWAMFPHGVLEILSKYGTLPLWGQCHQLSSARELTAIVVTPIGCLMNVGGGV